MTESIAVSSGKGGVGKTTIAVNVALTLSVEAANLPSVMFFQGGHEKHSLFLALWIRSHLS